MGRTNPPGEPIDRFWRAGRRRAGLLALAVAATACADGQAPAAPSPWAERGVEAAATDPPERGAEVRVTPASVTAPMTTETTTTLVPPVPTDPPRADPPTIGELVVPCGGAGDGGDVGIDAETIVLGVGNDRGGRTMSSSARGVVEAIWALADRCNALGGIAGRQIVVEEFDAAVAEVAPRIAEACETVFALVGQAYLRDDEGESTRVDCGLPAFPSWSTGAGDEADFLVSALPSTPNPVPLHANFAALLGSPADGGRVALVGPDTVGGGQVRVRRAFALLASGLPFEVVAELGYDVEVDVDWTEIVVAARRADAAVVHVDGSCRVALVPFLVAAAAEGWDPAVIAGSEAYDAECIADADAVGVSFERVLIELPLLPVEDGAAAPATAAIVEIYEELGVAVTGDSLRAASAFWLWAAAAEACGPGLDRNCVVAQARSIDAWSAGGLHAVSDPGTSAMEPCAVVLGVEDGVFVRRLPIEPGTFDCEPLA